MRTNESIVEKSLLRRNLIEDKIVISIKRLELKIQKEKPRMLLSYIIDSIQTKKGEKSKSIMSLKFPKSFSSFCWTFDIRIVKFRKQLKYFL